MTSSLSGKCVTQLLSKSQQKVAAEKGPSLDGMIHKRIDGLSGGEYAAQVPLIKRLHALKHKEVLRECTLELQRRGGNFVCIYPARGSQIYDRFFEQPRPLNRFVHSILCTDELEPKEAPAVLNPRVSLNSRTLGSDVHKESIKMLQTKLDCDLVSKAIEPTKVEDEPPAEVKKEKVPTS